jgi:Fe-S-cluster containining protein
MLAPDQLAAEAKRSGPATKKLFDRLKRTKPKDLDERFHRLHDEAFEQIDCLTCANCCRTTSPIFYQKDIERLAKALRLRPSEFMARYLHVDADGDYVLNVAPCPFLGPDNYCSVYADRPTACREYPHTNRKRMVQVLDLAAKNAVICPAVQWIVERLKVELG